MDKVESECVLCVQEAEIIALGHCNHKTFCYQCMIKMRVISKIKACPICKQILDKIILTDNLQAQFSDYSISNLMSINYSKDSKDVFFTDSAQIKEKIEGLNSFKCPFQDCQMDQQISNFNQLKLHLKVEHMRFYCDVCIEQKTCFLGEQQLYSDYQVRRHMNNGDLDEDSNIIFKHPFCKFCRKHFYDEDKFKQHLNLAHINCSLCEDMKFTFYKDHGSYERHLKLSHFLCEEPECKQMLVVFKNQCELDMHKQSHCNDPRIKKMSNLNVQQIAGFYEDPKQKKQLNDKEGEDFTDQFISLEQTKLRAVTQIDQHKDENIDFREYLYVDYNDDQDKLSDQSEKMHSQQNIFLEDLQLIKPYTLPHMKFQSFMAKCSQFFKGQKNKEESLRKLIQLFETDKMSAEHYVNSFIQMFEPKTGLRLITFYMAMKDVKDQFSKILDDAYIKQLKALPRRNNPIIIVCKTYSELFIKLLEELNKNLIKRIEDGDLVQYQDTIMPKERIFQLIEVLRHVKTSEMGKFKFALNFGLSTQMIFQKFNVKNFIIYQLEHISAISNHDLVPFYLYVNLSMKILRGEQIHKEKKDLNECVYYEFFQNNKKLFSLIKKPDNSDLNRQNLLQKQNQLNRNGIEMNPADFPSLPKAQKQEQKLEQQFYVKQNEPQQQQQQVKKSKQRQQQSQAIGKWQNSGAAIFQNQAAIEDQFPSLTSNTTQAPSKNVKSNNGQFQDDDFVPLADYKSAKQNEESEWDSNPIIPKKNTQMKEVAQIKKKNKNIVQISGGFR
ncbi:unnamed protein product (macronuclear) [Paramecium tetraurelia]|uniref:RING-type E3 ubiquitin transferase n=1 Tax=Paramecium tetraurelia TaxID=5888 RepID=A0DY10_PARTE|nr:uncharacterized protein GSPATT00021552001 [Paramecium tetraurelia]CAK87927.1 unnamed protein product [Paramecium tetraurelia]|eukprot:XP_001455324.1 hypothetical protein (macronuclear) [Paramecium tetraurelia strain d4-2]